MGEPLLKGTYNAKLLFLPVTQQAPEGSVDLELWGLGHAQPVKDRVNLGQKSADDSGMVVASYPVETDQGFLQLDLKPVAGKVYLSGVVLEPTRV
jgi:hypothetical protein